MESSTRTVFNDEKVQELTDIILKRRRPSTLGLFFGPLCTRPISVPVLQRDLSDFDSGSGLPTFHHAFTQYYVETWVRPEFSQNLWISAVDTVHYMPAGCAPDDPMEDMKLVIIYEHQTDPPVSHLNRYAKSLMHHRGPPWYGSILVLALDEEGAVVDFPTNQMEIDLAKRAVISAIHYLTRTPSG